MKRTKGIYLALLVLLSPMANADPVTYTYEGNPYDSGIIGDYDSAMSLTGSITVAAPLGELPALTNITALITAFSFSDGLQTITDADALISSIFRVGTDANGDIADWEFSLAVTGLWSIESRNAFFGFPIDSRIEVDDVSFLNSNDNRAASFVPGTWRQVDPSPVPEPGALALLSLGLVGMAATTQKESLTKLQ